MNIVYCDTCGVSIPEPHLATGRAVRAGVNTYCENCKSTLPTQEAPRIEVRPGAAGSNSRNRAIKNTPMGGSAQNIQPAGGGSKSNARARAIAASLAAHQPPPEPVVPIDNTPYIIGSVVALLCLGVFSYFAFGDNGVEVPQRAGTKSVVHPEPPPVAPVTPGPPPVTPETTVLPDSTQPLRTKPQPLEDAATTALASLFEGVKEDDAAAQTVRLEDFLKKYENTFAGARARVLLKNLYTTGSMATPIKSAAPPPPPPPPTPVQPPPPDASNEPIAYWPCNEGAGAVAAPEKGKWPLKLKGVTWGEGKTGKALKFDGAEETATFDDLAISTNAFTVACWVFHDDTRTKIERYVSLGGDAVCLRHHGTTSVALVEFFARIGGTLHSIKVEKLAFKKWVHVAGSWDGANLRLYVDGRLAKLIPATGRFVMPATGGMLGSATDNLKGLLDEIRVYNRALTDTEVINLAK